jgi:DNA-binding MarR family transcriptional regulator
VSADASRVWVLMRELVLERHDRRAEIAKELGMTYLKVKALRRVARGPLAMRELTEHLSTDRPYTTVLVDDLERRGLLVRTENPGDRRSRLVTLTDEGRAVAARADAMLAVPPDAMLALDGRDLADLERVLTTLAGDQSG